MKYLFLYGDQKHCPIGDNLFACLSPNNLLILLYNIGVSK